MDGGLIMAKIEWKTKEEIEKEQNQPSELETLRKQQELMQQAIDDMIFGGAL
jgi:hypothetical protein